VLFVLGLILVLNNRKSPEIVQPISPIMSDDNGDSAAEEIMTPATGGYTNYDSSHLSFANEGKVVLFFNAKWCPTCRALTKDVQSKISEIPEDVLILSIDYDSEKELKKKYGITYQHTLVQIDSLGNQIKKWSGSPNLESLLSNIQ
ncbi:thioredoxin, partial [candidate division WWE3 bacterium]